MGASRGLSRKVMDCRIVSSHGVSRRVTGFSFYHGLSDFFFFLHTESRGGHELLNYRIFFTRSVAEGHELSNYLHTECRRRSRIFLHTECWECGGVGDEEVWVLVFVCDS